MIAAFLLPFPIRGVEAPYLWVYYRLLTSYTEPILFLACSAYRRSPSDWVNMTRWELDLGSAQRLGYRVPTQECMQRQIYRDIDNTLFEHLLRECAENPVAVFKKLLTERVPQLEAYFERNIHERTGPDIEAILTWCNCPSLSAVAARKGIPVAHLEIGPLRWPEYRQTAYMDFTGVNGNTEAAKRYKSADWLVSNIDVGQLRGYFSVAAEYQALAAAEYDVGIPLQVEDDSNLIAFGRGFDNQSLLVFALLNYSKEKVLVRSHPGSLFGARAGWYVNDDSTSSIPFILRSRRIVTINSSVGLEAILLERDVKVMGDCSYSFVCEAECQLETARRLAFYLFAYLVPFELIFSVEYLRFRLGRPSEQEIVATHLKAYGLDLNALRFQGAGDCAEMKVIQ